MKLCLKDSICSAIFENLLAAHKNMATAERVDVKGFLRLTKYLMRLTEQMENVVVEVGTKNE